MMTKIGKITRTSGLLIILKFFKLVVFTIKQFFFYIFNFNKIILIYALLHKSLLVNPSSSVFNLLSNSWINFDLILWNKEIIQFAEKLITLGNKKAILRLNRFVDVFGSDVNHEMIISKIKSEFYIDSQIEKSEKALRDELAKARKERLERERIAKENTARNQELNKIKEQNLKTLNKCF